MTAASRFKYTRAICRSLETTLSPGAAISGETASTADDNFGLTWTRFLGGGTTTMLEVLDSYQTAEQLRLLHFDQEFNAREAVAETSLLFGRVQ